MERSYLEYAMSVIVARALPDVRDGMKPVHRRILYGMWDTGLRPDRPHVKCAKVVGDVMGRFHPHGDMAIYDALARMVQDFSLRHPLVDGHGDFGAPGPDGLPAAMRYTEARLAPLAMSLLEGIDEDTVDLVPNYDGSDEEPVVLPARFPNLLVNGSQGIAVGMATNIPPHNLAEVIDATRHLLAHPEAKSDELMQFVKGPDFPTGGLILGRAGILDAYRTGRGSVKTRAVAEITELRSGVSQIVVTEIPYQTAVETIEKQIAEGIEAGQITGISAVDNLSAAAKPRLVVTLKRDANANVVLNNLFKHTQLQTSFGMHMLALVDGVPRLVNLAQALTAYVAHQVEVVTRRSRVPAEAGPRPGPHRRGTAAGDRHARRGDRDDPRLGGPGRRPHEPHGRAVLVLRGPGEPHPRHDARPAHAARAGRARHRRWPSSSPRSASSRRSSATRPSCAA